MLSVPPAKSSSVFFYINVSFSVLKEYHLTPGIICEYECVHMCVHLHVCMHVRVCVGVHVCKCVYVCVCACMSAHVYVHTSICVCTHMCVCMYGVHMCM